MIISQPDFIKHIIEAITGIDKVNPKAIQISPNTTMTKDDNGKERQEKYNHRLLIGMLNYLIILHI